MTDAKQTSAETLLAKLHDQLWGSECMSHMREDQYMLMEEVQEFIRARDLDGDAAPPDPSDDLARVHIGNISVEGVRSISTDETVLLQDGVFYATVSRLVDDQAWASRLPSRSDVGAGRSRFGLARSH